METWLGGKNVVVLLDKMKEKRVSMSTVRSGAFPK